MNSIFFHSSTLSASVVHLDSSQPLLSSSDFLLEAFASAAYLTSLAGSIRCSSAGSFVPFLTLLRSSLQRFGCSPFSVVSSDSCKVSLVFRIGHVRYINILAWFRGFRNKFLYLVLFLLYPSSFGN